jgi:hypothetical protein
MKQLDVRELEQKAQSLESAIHELERRGNHLTPEDQERAAELNRLRLAAKDRLAALKGH